jgi:hypothetical protein
MPTDVSDVVNGKNGKELLASTIITDYFLVLSASSSGMVKVACGQGQADCIKRDRGE